MKKNVLRIFTIAFLLFMYQACNEPYGPSEQPIDDIPYGIEKAIQNAPEVAKVHELVDDHFFQNPLVIGTGISADENGITFIIVFTTEKVEHRSDVALENIGKGNDKFALPTKVDGVSISSVVTDEFQAFLDPSDRFPRPVPIGVSTGHPDITAGTIGCRVKDAQGNVYALSNNHVYADENQASKGDNVIQPGTYDGGSSPADDIGTLAGFVPIKFGGADNFVDAAIASTTTSLVGYSTLVGGYGTPSSTTVDATIRMRVQKFGRTTGLTKGRIYAVNTSVDVGYDGGVARFVNQIIITPGTFSAGGDSGSLIVSISGNNPVGLLFAGSTQYTIANPIDAVLNAFGVTIDDGSGGGGNLPPSADFNYSDNLLNVTFTDNSTDPDGTIVIWDWEFGDGNGSAEQNTSHTYAASGTYAVTLTVTDNEGATNNVVKSVTVSDGSSTGISDLAASVRTKGANKVTLVWTGGSPTVEIKRDDIIIATVENTGTYTDVLGKNTGTFEYQVCSADGSGCSDPYSVTISE